MHYARSHSLVVTGSSGISVPVGWKGCGQRSLSSIMGRARIAPVSAGDCALASDTAQALSLGVRHGWEIAGNQGSWESKVFSVASKLGVMECLKKCIHVPVQMPMRRLCTTHGLEAPKCVCPGCCLWAEMGCRRKSKRERREGA